MASANGKVGSLVWVQRKNGTWWPGKIEFSSFTSKSAVKLLGREDGSVEWFNLEKSKRIKAFRSVEFDDFIRSVESSQTSHYKKTAKYVHREHAILQALLLEKQEQEKGHKRPGNLKQGALYRAKRSRCAYLAVESNNHVKHPVLHSQSLKVFLTSCEVEENSHNSSLGSYTSAKQTRIRNVQKKERVSNSSRSSPDSKFAVGEGKQNWNLKEKCYSQDSSGTPDTVTQGESSNVPRKQVSKKQDQLTMDFDYQENRRIGYKVSKKSCKHLALEVNMLSNSTSGAENSGSESLCCDPVYTNLQDTIKTMLVDVDVTVQGNYRKEHVPLVSLMSKLNKVAIIGHPIEVDVLENIPEDLLSRMGSNHDMMNSGGSKFHGLVWRTSKRSPVCYIPIHNSFATSNPEAKKTVVLQAEKGNFSMKNGHDVLISGQNSEEVSFKKRAGSILSEATCVPVNLIFSKLFSAIST